MKKKPNFLQKSKKCKLFLWLYERYQKFVIEYKKYRKFMIEHVNNEDYQIKTIHKLIGYPIGFFLAILLIYWLFKMLF